MPVVGVARHLLELFPSSMNLLLLLLADFLSRQEDEDSGVVTGEVQLLAEDRRMKHILKVLKLDVGGSLRVGEVDGKIGTASIAEMDPAARMVLTVRLDQAPPAPLPITLIIAMPRPKVFTPLLESVATLGFKHIHLIATDRVDKTYWASHTLQPPHINEHLTLGLEQTEDTIMPKVHVWGKNTDKFIEKFLPDLMREGDPLNLCAHPHDGAIECPRAPLGRQCNLLIGPEGGFIPPEVDRWAEIGFQPVTLGTRILPVLTAVHILTGRLAM